MKKIYLLIICFSFFTVHFSLAQTWLWGEHGNEWALGKSVSTDKEGNCYFGGYFVSQDTLIFSDSILYNPYHNPYGFSFFLVKYNSSGDLLWVRQSYNYGNYVAYNGAIVATDRNSSVYIVTSYQDTLLTGEDTLVCPVINYAIAKYNSTGNWLWTSSPTFRNNDTNEISANYVCTDNYGNVFVTGAFIGDTINFNSHYIFGFTLNTAPYLVKYDSSGNVLWAEAGSDHNNKDNASEAEYVTSDLNGNAYITGSFFDTVWFDSYRLVTYPSGFYVSPDVFLVKYSANGTVVWAKQAVLASSSSFCQGEAVVCDKSGNVYLAGNFVDTATFGAYTLIGSGATRNRYQQANLYLVKYDSGGNVLWAKQGTVLDSNSWGVATMSIDKYNHIFLSGGGGAYHCKIVFGTDTLSMFDTAVYDQSSILVKFDSNGNVLCSTIIAGGGHYTNSISSDSSGNHVYFGSCTSTVLAFGSDTVNPFSYPTHPASGIRNFLPFVARWDECGDITTSTYSPPKENMRSEIYPNPNNGTFTLALSHAELVSACLPNRQASQIKLEVYNMMGEKIYFATLKQVQGDNLINLSDKPNGIYLYRVLSENGELVGEGKLIIEK